MTQSGADVHHRVVSGVRAVLILNYVTIPLNFLSNVVFGRIDPEALGYAGALQLFIGGLLTFSVLGGPKVFVRYVPAIAPERRTSFLTSYLLVVIALSLMVGAVLYVVVPGWTAALLAKFGSPALPVLVSVAIAVVIWAFCSFFLFGALAPGRAAVTSRIVNPGYLVAALLGLGPLRPQIEASPATFIWTASLVIYAIGAVYGVAAVATVPELKGSGRLHWYLPAGFWGVAVYTHMARFIEFIYWTLSPYFVLLWMDVTSLAYFQAATRFPFFLGMLPAMLTDVLAPALSALNVSGSRDRALAQSATAIRALLVPTVPIALVFIFFAGDGMAVFNPGFRDHRDLLRIVAVSSAAAPAYFLGTGLLAALGAFRSYLLASSIYVLTALPMAAALIPTFGLEGAAWTLTLGTAVQQAALTWVLRRQVGFRMPARATVAWLVLALAATTAEWIDPGRLLATLLAVVFGLLFAAVGRVTPAEVTTLVRRFAFRS